MLAASNCIPSRLRLTVLVTVVASATGILGPLAAQVLPLPPRPSQAKAGSQLLPILVGHSVQDREDLLWQEISSGNVPDFLRALVPVTTSATVGSTSHTATFWVTPDYVAVGSDTDFFRMPMTPRLAQQLANLTGCSLPTRKMVNAIYSQATVQLAPSFFNPSVYTITSPTIFYQHQLQIETQRAGLPLGLLLGGIKKDVVISPLIAAWPGRVVIYGWHQLNGVPIQPLSKVHTETYTDYSHGIRLVQRTMTIDGVPADVPTVLADPLLAPVLSDEGAFTSSSYPVPAPPPSFPMIDLVPAAGPVLPWVPRFTSPTTVFQQPAAPGGDGYVLRVNDSAGGTDTVRLGSVATTDSVFQADVFCEYRPGLAVDGYERVGIFVRDMAQGSFDGPLSTQGACYALTWDSDDGRLRCMRVSGGVRHDFLPTPMYRPSTAWRRFRIEARAAELTFLVDGAIVLSVNDGAFPSGTFGVGYRESFATNSNMRGTRADNLFADLPDAVATQFEVDAATGGLRLMSSRGVPGDLCFRGITASPGAFPNGPFFGIDLSLADAFLLYGTGHPIFVGTFDGDRKSVV